MPLRVVLAAVALAACKADPPERTAAAPGSAPAPVASAPAAPAPPSPSPAPPADAPALAELVPAVEGAKLLSRRVRDEGYAVAAWCIDEHDAIARVTAALERDGWRDIRTRGRGERIGIAATRGEARFSATAGGRDDRCAGTLVTGTVMRLGELRLPAAHGR